MTAMRLPCMRFALLVLLVACSRDKAADAPLEQRGIAKPAVEKPPARREGDKKAPARPAQLSQVTIKALGMYCEESCPAKVRYALADDPKVYELGLDLSTESIFISYDASLGAPKEVTKSMLTAIKTKAGFDPWLAKESWPDHAQTKVQVVWR